MNEQRKCLDVRHTIQKYNRYSHIQKQKRISDCLESVHLCNPYTS